MKTKITYEFDLPDDESLMRSIINGPKWCYVVNELNRELRSLLKYHELSSDEIILAENIQQMLLEYVGDEGLELE